MNTALHRTLAVPPTQRERADHTQVVNNAGGYVYELSPEKALERFLILGTEGGTFYANERKLTQDAMRLVTQCVADMEPDVYFGLVESCAPNARKRTYALWAISEALVSGSPEMKARVPHAVKAVVQTGTDLFELASYVRGRRGWGPTVQAAFDAILAELPEDKLALWAVKYRDRNGYTWRDLLRLQHTKANTEERDEIFKFMTKGEALDVFPVITGYRKAKGVTDEAKIIEIVNEYRLPWEALADEQRTDQVWKACLPNIGDTAVLRNCASFTRRGLDQDLTVRQAVADRIARSSKLHPVQTLEALRTYQSGGSVGRSKGGTYRPNPRWTEAMEDALERSFTEGVTKTGQRIMMAMDISGSMDWPFAGSAVLTQREIAAAIALGYVKAEDNACVFAFGTQFTHLPWSRKTSFAEAIDSTRRLGMQGTDCSLPMLVAQHEKINIDTFVVITDNETWAGKVQPMQALRNYRQSSGIFAKLAVVGLSATKFTIADPRDPATMDFAGFTSDLPRSIEKFMTLT